MERAIICDLDSTLIDISARVHHIIKKPKDFKAFYADIKSDRINIWCAELVRAMYLQGCKIIYITGRSEECREETLMKLRTDVGIPEGTWELYMRGADKIGTEDVDLKREIYNDKVKDKYDVLFVVEDRQRVVDFWRKEGLICLQCAEGKY